MNVKFDCSLELIFLLCLATSVGGKNKNKTNYSILSKEVKKEE